MFENKSFIGECLIWFLGIFLVVLAIGIVVAPFILVLYCGKLSWLLAYLVIVPIGTTSIRRLLFN